MVDQVQLASVLIALVESGRRAGRLLLPALSRLQCWGTRTGFLPKPCLHRILHYGLESRVLFQSASAYLTHSATERLGGLQMPASGCDASSLVKSLRLCWYPTQGGFRCAGVTRPNSKTRWARCMICACNWGCCGMPRTPHHACTPIGKKAR